MRYRQQVIDHGGIAPRFLPLLLKKFFGGYELWEYSDMRGPLDGDGGFALVNKQGVVVYRFPVWFS
jgi:hypothetical protein